MSTRTHSVGVSVRLRPPTSPDTSAATLSACAAFAYPAAVIEGSDQRAACSALTDHLLDKLRAGFSCTLLAYGQTGSGKTYTMFGPPGAITESALERASVGGGGGGGADGGGGGGTDDGAPSHWGVFPRTMLKLLRMPGLGSFHASAIEVYMEKVRDLLSPCGQGKEVKVGA